MTHRPWSENSDLRGLGWVAVAACAALLSGWLISKSASVFPRHLEKRLGRLVNINQLGPVCDVTHELAWQELINLVARLYPQQPQETKAPITLRLVERSEVNAFAALGGEIILFTGMLQAAPSPDVLAGVLAHELEHVSQRHVLRKVLDDTAFSVVILALLGYGSALGRIAENVDYWSKLPFSRAQEAEADKGAVRRLRAASVALGPLADFFSSLDGSVQLPSWASDHPGLKARVQALRAEPPYPSTPAMSWPRWQALQSVCGGASSNAQVQKSPRGAGDDSPTQ